MAHRAYKIIEKARSKLESWAEARSISLHKIDFVAAFEPWSDSLGVWAFYKLRTEVETCEKDGTSDAIREEFLELLKKYKYPFDEFPQVDFEFSSHQEVEEDFEGSYFYRLR